MESTNAHEPKSGESLFDWKVWSNLVGALLYLFVSMPLWAQHELKDTPGAGAGDPLIWALVALPILVAFFLLDVGIVVAATIRRLRVGRWGLPVAFALVPLVWLGIVSLDFSMHWTM